MDVVATRLKGNGQRNQRVDVTDRSQRREQDSHPRILPQSKAYADGCSGMGHQCDTPVLTETDDVAEVSSLRSTGSDGSPGRWKLGRPLYESHVIRCWRTTSACLAPHNRSYLDVDGHPPTPV